jgi:hypothetical protein
VFQNLCKLLSNRSTTVHSNNGMSHLILPNLSTFPLCVTWNRIQRFRNWIFSVICPSCKNVFSSAVPFLLSVRTLCTFVALTPSPSPQRNVVTVVLSACVTHLVLRVSQHETRNGGLYIHKNNIGRFYTLFCTQNNVVYRMPFCLSIRKCRVLKGEGCVCKLRNYQLVKKGLSDEDICLQFSKYEMNAYFMTSI